MSQCKPLHLGKKIEDLEKQFELPKSVFDKKVLQLCNSAKHLKEKAELCYIEKDEEAAYVNYMKYLNLVDTIRRNREYAEKKTQIMALLGRKQDMNIIYDRLEQLKANLILRYNKANVAKECSDLRSIAKIVVPSIAQTKTIIVAKELFEMINDNKLSMLIMDCRSEKDFEASNIKYDYVVNVPDALLVAGMTASKIHNKLPVPAKTVFSSRTVKENIVLMDYSTQGVPKKDSPLWVLLDILKRWDEDVSYKNPLLTVEGGYKAFALHYPMCCTNPNYSPSVIEPTNERRFEDIEYPNISDIPMKDDSFGSQKRPPLVDRNSKAAAIHRYEEKSKPVQEMLEERLKLLDRSIKNEQEILTTEQELQEVEQKVETVNDDVEMQNLRQYAKALEYQMLQLQNSQQDIETENSNLREEIKLYKTTLHNAKSEGETVPNEEAIRLEEEAQKRIKEKEEEQKRCQEQRLMMLKVAREQKRHMKENIDNGEIRQAKIPQFDRAAKPSLDLSEYNHNMQREVIRDFAPVLGNVGRGLTGLKNLGNTCYMNSILQCLSNTMFLTEYFLEGSFRHKLNRSNKTQGRIAEEVAAVIKALWTGQYKCIASKNLRYVVGQYERQFGGIEQQDSHEFLTILMDWLHSDLQTVPIEINVPRESLPASERAWLTYLNGTESYISQLFYGQIKSTVKCVQCHKESATYESFSNLSLELPPVANRCHLEECLNMYFDGERIRGWNCPQCKRNQEAIKKLDISRLPSILVIHFKRFYADPDSLSTVYRKKQNYVKFPLIEFDVSSYIAPSELSRNNNLRKSRYHLYGVSNHYGSMESGHYTAFCRNAPHQKWYKFDDHSVSSLDSSDVCSSAAYILFYSRFPEQQETMTMR